MPSCTEEGCPVLETGICLNQFTDLKECPHYSISNAKADQNDDKELRNEEEDLTNEENDAIARKTNTFETNVVPVYSGRAFTLKEVNRISMCALTRFIILAGMPDSGKTTLLLSLIHLFETNNAFEGYIFA